MTRGDQGIWLLSNVLEGHLPASAREVADVTGAGDTVIATLAVALSSGATLGEAARLANEAAGIVVGRFGPATTSTTELIAAVTCNAGWVLVFGPRARRVSRQDPPYDGNWIRPIVTRIGITTATSASPAINPAATGIE